MHYNRYTKITGAIICWGVLAVMTLGVRCCRTCNGPNGPNGPIFQDRESFTLAYMDKNEWVRVRWSINGSTWSLSNLENAGTDKGVAAAAEERGVVQLIAYPHLSAGLNLRFGLNGATWDSSSIHRSSDEEGNRLHFSIAPSVVHTASNRWLIAFKSYDKVKVVTYNQSVRKILSPERTPLPSLGVSNSLVIFRPAMVNRNGRIVLSWLRNTSPRQLQMVAGNIDNIGDPLWTDAYLFHLSEPGFGPILSGPSLTHDHSKFYLGEIRKAVDSETYTLFIYSSNDGVSWQLSDRLPNVPFAEDVPTRVQIAAHSDGTMLAGFTGIAPQVHRRHPTSGWYQLSNSMVFGSETPSWQPMALISVGRPPSE